MIKLSWQVKTIKMAKNDGSNSVLISAAINKSPDVFGAVWSRIEKDLPPQEVQHNDGS